MSDTQHPSAVSTSHCILHNGILVFRITSPVDDALGKELDECGRKYLDERTVDRVLIDIRGSSTFSVNARIRWVAFLKHTHIRKAAIFGGGALVRVLASVMITLSKRKNVRYFLTEAEASDWLAT